MRHLSTSLETKGNPVREVESGAPQPLGSEWLTRIQNGSPLKHGLTQEQNANIVFVQRRSETNQDQPRWAVDNKGDYLWVRLQRSPSSRPS
jgi:hypothetical protein